MSQIDHNTKYSEAWYGHWTSNFRTGKTDVNFRPDAIPISCLSFLVRLVTLSLQMWACSLQMVTQVTQADGGYQVTHPGAGERPVTSDQQGRRTGGKGIQYTRYRGTRVRKMCPWSPKTKTKHRESLINITYNKLVFYVLRFTYFMYTFLSNP